MVQNGEKLIEKYSYLDKRLKSCLQLLQLESLNIAIMYKFRNVAKFKKYISQKPKITILLF